MLLTVRWLLLLILVFHVLKQVAKLVRPLVLGLILCASHSRTFSLLNGYSAPLQIYRHLEYHEDAGNGEKIYTSCTFFHLAFALMKPHQFGELLIWYLWAGSVVCVGSEWHRFPSSFFIPSYVGEVRWIDDGFQGLLPFPFNATLGGTAAAPSYFNDKNMRSDEQYVSPFVPNPPFWIIKHYCCLNNMNIDPICDKELHEFKVNVFWLSSSQQLCLIVFSVKLIVESNFISFYYWLQLRDVNACTFLVELDLKRAYPSRGSDLATWEVRSTYKIYFPVI